jgi:phosphoglycerate dehydrogenase-like enzyme
MHEGSAETRVAVYLRGDPAAYRERLCDVSGVRFRFCRCAAELGEAVVDAHVLLCFDVPSASIVAKARSLRWIQAAAAGVDAFLEAGLPLDGVVLTRVSEGFGQPIAEYVLGHLLALSQRLTAIRSAQAERLWAPFAVELLAGQTLGVVGTGVIGQAVAHRAVGLGMRAIGLSRSGVAVSPFERVDPIDRRLAFLGEVNALVLCLPLTPETRHLIGRQELAALRRGAILVNVARGAVVDEAALIETLQRGGIRAAVLDVFEEEPLPADSPLWGMENVTITPHHAGLNRPEIISSIFLDNLARFRAGEPLHGIVNLEQGY